MKEKRKHLGNNKQSNKLQAKSNKQEEAGRNAYWGIGEHGQLHNNLNSLQEPAKIA